MARPQFTTRTLLVSVTCLAVSFGCLRGAIELYYALDWVRFLGVALVVASIACLGAEIGVLFKGPLVGVAIGVIIAMAAGFVISTFLAITAN